jgi:hypothetical protein
LLLPLDVVHNQLGRLRVQLRRAVFMQVGWVTALLVRDRESSRFTVRSGTQRARIPRIFRMIGNCPINARTVQGMACAQSGQAPAWPLVSDRSVRRSPGSSVTSHVRSQATFHLCSSSCGYSHAGGADTYAQRAISGSDPARTPALSASPASACQGMRWQRQPVQAGGVFGHCSPRPRR